MVETLFSRLESELCGLRDAPLEIVASGILWTIQVVSGIIVMADPPEKIKEFSVRKNKQTGRDATLKNLPHHVESTLIAILGFGEDLLGYGHDALKSTPSRVQQSRFYIELGATDSERSDRFAQLKRERRDWRGSLFKALQLAMRDIRSYEYGADENKWPPNNRQAKRALPGNDGYKSPDMFVGNDENDLTRVIRHQSLPGTANIVFIHITFHVLHDWSC
ncbi:hypothetical protein ANCCAN_15741 [Ancylostoma caninum]|uniref:Uncharacterized protein n=1 Tax=Ancylostoma caninum TaxID=29170 RepID=A0A368G1W3_ANCCA|nr:hypothetical protein ANCCAN_15741 [Ancylostoma caninum]